MSYGFNKQSDTATTIKRFGLDLIQFNWTNTKYNGVYVLTPTDKKTDVYIPNNLIVGGTINGLSDIYLKEDIVDLDEEIMGKVDSLVPKKYIFKKDETKKIHYGLIAQEVEEILPNLVNEIEIEGVIVKTVNYIEIIPILLKKIQDLQKQMNNLEKGMTK